MADEEKEQTAEISDGIEVRRRVVCNTPPGRLGPIACNAFAKCWNHWAFDMALRSAEKRGAAKMRERAADLCAETVGPGFDPWGLEKKIRALPCVVE